MAVVTHNLKMCIKHENQHFIYKGKHLHVGKHQVFFGALEIHLEDMCSLKLFRGEGSVEFWVREYVYEKIVT